MICTNINIIYASTEEYETNISNGQLVKKYQEEQKIIQEESSNIIENEQESNEIYSNLIKEMTDESDIFPDYYAGSYIDDDGELVICVTDSSDNVKNEIKEFTDSEDYEIKKMNVSYNDLLELQENITEYYMENYHNSDNVKINELLDSYVGSGIDEAENKLIVDINELTDEKVEIFKEYISDNDNIVFEDVSMMKCDASAWKLGRAIYRYKSTSGSTVYSSVYSTGFRCKRLVTTGMYYYGFVTSAHGSNTVGSALYTTAGCSTKLGTIIARKQSGSVDAVFVNVTNSNFEVSNQVLYSNSTGSTSSGKTLSASVLIVASGTTVYKAGSTTYLTKGTVQSTSYSGTFDGVTLSNVIKATYNGDGGDSGGIVYASYNSVYGIVGIHEGHNSSYTFAINASKIISGLSVILY